MKRRFLRSVWLGSASLLLGVLMAQSTIEKTGKKVETGAKQDGRSHRQRQPRKWGR